MYSNKLDEIKYQAVSRGPLFRQYLDGSLGEHHSCLWRWTDSETSADLEVSARLPLLLSLADLLVDLAFSDEIIEKGGKMKRML